MAKSTAVATTEDQSQLPAYLQDSKYVNEDNFDQSDVVIPRIKLLQGLSEEIQNSVPGAKIGHFWHAGMDFDLGSEFKFIVADRRKKYLLIAPISDGQGVLARADDAENWDREGSWQVKIKGVKQPVTWEITNKKVLESGLASWGTSIPDDEDSPPAATLFYDYLVFCPEHPELGMAVISLSRSQVRQAKKGLNDKIKMQGENGRPMQALIFNARSIDDTADGQDFKNWAFTSAGFVQDKELFDQMRQYRGALADLKIKDETGDVAETSAVDDGEGKF